MGGGFSLTAEHTGGETSRAEGWSPEGGAADYITDPRGSSPPPGLGRPKLKMAEGEDNKGGGHFVAEDNSKSDRQGSARAAIALQNSLQLKKEEKKRRPPPR